MWTAREDEQRHGSQPALEWQDWPARREWQEATDTLRRLGRRTGNEHAITLRPTGECVGGTMCGDRHVVNVGPDVLDRLDQPGEELAVCHSHPASPDAPPNELSAPDLVLLGRRGVRSLHMVSPYEPNGYSIAHRSLELDALTWRRIVALARDIAYELVSEDDATSYRTAHRLDRLDHQRVMVRVLHIAGLIEWQRRFDGATARFEDRHGAFLDEIALEACERFARAFSSNGTVWVDPGTAGVCHAGEAGRLVIPRAMPPRDALARLHGRGQA